MRFWDGQRWIDEPTPAPSRSPRTTSRFFHVGQALLEGALIAALAVGLIAGSAFAAKGGNGATKAHHGANSTSSSLSLVMVVDANGNGGPNWNDQVTFDVSTTATDKPWVSLNCYQDGAWVSTATAGFFPAYPWPATYTLASGMWTSGAADCTARLYMVNRNGKSSTLATLSFHVDA